MAPLEFCPNLDGRQGRDSDIHARLAAEEHGSLKAKAPEDPRCNEDAAQCKLFEVCLRYGVVVCCSYIWAI